MPQSSDGMPWMRLVLAILTLAIAGSTLAAADAVPLPRARPPIWLEPHSFAEAVAGLDFDAADVSSDPTPCDARLADLAAIERLPRLIGPGACGGRALVEGVAVRGAHNNRVAGG